MAAERYLYIPDDRGELPVALGELLGLENDHFIHEIRLPKLLIVVNVAVVFGVLWVRGGLLVLPLLSF